MPKHIADPSLDCKKLNAHQKNFLEKTAEKIKEYQIKKKRERERNYRLNNAEKIKAQQKNSYQQRREQIKAYQRNYYQQIAEKLKAKLSINSKSYYQQNGEKIKKQKKERNRLKELSSLKSTFAVTGQTSEKLCKIEEEDSGCQFSEEFNQNRALLERNDILIKEEEI